MATPAALKSRLEMSLSMAMALAIGPLPVLLTCEKGLVEPRYPSLPNLMKAKKKQVV